MKIKNHNGNIEECFYKILGKEDVPEMVKLEKDILDDLEDKNFYASSSYDDFMNIITNYNNTILGIVTEDNKLVAMGVYVKFNEYKENYSYDFDEKVDYNAVGNIESTVVRKEYRGNGIQKLICIELEKYALLDGINILGATVAPENKFSLNNFLSLKYEICNEKIKYGGFRRYILKKKIS